MVISSKENRVVKLWRQLSADGRARRKQGLFAVEGARLCMDAALSDVRIQTVLYTARAAEQYAEHLRAVLAVAQSDFEITAPVAQFMADTATPQGVFCICEMPASAGWTLRCDGRYLALEDLQDPSNLGTVIRTAEALGLDGLLLSAGCCDVYSPKVLRGSMGGVFRLPLLQVSDMTAAVADWRKCGLRVYACVPDADAVSVCDAAMGDGCIPVIGNEGNGLKNETIAACDARVTIPMGGRAESLNAAMAAGIVMWELKRRCDI